MKYINLFEQNISLYNTTHNLYCPIGLEESIRSCCIGHLINYSDNPYSIDYEIIEFGCPEVTYMDDEEMFEYIKDLVTWKEFDKGVNLFNDLGTAEDYDDYVAILDVSCDAVDISAVHVLSENPEGCKLEYIHYKNNTYLPIHFLEFKFVQEYLCENIPELVNHITKIVLPEIEKKYKHLFTANDAGLL